MKKPIIASDVQQLRLSNKVNANGILFKRVQGRILKPNYCIY